LLRAGLMLLISLGGNFVSAQEKKRSGIVYAVDKGGYFYIPKSALSDNVDGIVYPKSIGRNVDAAKRPIEFYWVSNCNDGYYNLWLTPEQIFFSSSHDNPNPNLLFWVIDIDRMQFEQIRKGFQYKRPPGFTDISDAYEGSMTVFFDSAFKDTFSIPEEWTDSILHDYDKYCEWQIASQLQRYFSIINSYIADPVKRIPIPVSRMKPKYFAGSREQIGSGMIKFTPPRIVKDQ
jgi:hypothetical protein